MTAAGTMLDSALSSTTMYATKRRRRSVKTVKPVVSKDPPKSNPSKRHRERLNGELDHLASLLPFEQSVISKLDRLSILRLAVCYLRTKSYFQAALHERYLSSGHVPPHSHHIFAEPCFADTDTVLQALNGFMFTVTCQGEVFFASRTVEQYLGFHQSDIIHQSALELIHSEDREEFKSQLSWRSALAPDQQDMSLQQVLMPENGHLLQRCFTVRFRCLLDNTSGFITLEISGRIKILTGQCLKAEAPAPEPPMALFALCCPFGPLPLLDVPPRDYTFKSKHKMDMAPLSMDPRGKLLFGFSDPDLVEKGGYDLIHPDDLTYYAAAHQELIKTGSSGLIAYRFHTKDLRWIWLQTSAKVIYKNSKPDFVICTHRHLTEDEGRDLVGKRGSEFKLPYPIIDTDPSGFGAALEDDDSGKLKGGSGGKKKSKTQLRDYLQAGRKRKTPYRDVVYNGATAGLNGYSAAAAAYGYQGEMKASDFLYSAYPGQTGFPTAAASLESAYYHPFPAAASTYPAGGGSLAEDKFSSYYPGVSAYQGYPHQTYSPAADLLPTKYSDVLAASQQQKSTGYGGGYDSGSYPGLDLSSSHKAGSHRGSSYMDPDYMDYKYADYSVDRLRHGAAGYGADMERLRLSAAAAAGSNGSAGGYCPPVDLMAPAAPGSQCYRSGTADKAAACVGEQQQQQQQHKSVITAPPPPVGGSGGGVIRAPRSGGHSNKSPDDGAGDVATQHYDNAAGSVWSACSKSAASCKSPIVESPRLTPPAETASSRLVSPADKPSSSPALGATSVIQSAHRARSVCESVAPGAGSPPSLPSGGTPVGSVAVVKGSSSWLHHPSTYDWAAAAEHSYITQHHRSGGYAPVVDPSVVTHTRFMEHPKVVCYNEAGW